MASVSAVLNRYREPADPLRSERRVELGVVILALVLLVQLLSTGLALLYATAPPVILPSPDSLLVSELERPGRVSAEQRNEIRARPVFWPSRRPYAGELENAGEVQPEPDSGKKGDLAKVKLLGVVGSGESAVIIAVVKGDKRRISRGDKVLGWTLDSIDPEGATFARNGQSQKLLLKRTRLNGAATTGTDSGDSKSATDRRMMNSE